MLPPVVNALLPDHEFFMKKRTLRFAMRAYAILKVDHRGSLRGKQIWPPYPTFRE
jgi:hypothetical protein